MDIRKSLAALDAINEGTMSSATKKPTGPKFPGYWKGKDSAKLSRSRMVGASESENLLQDLDKQIVEGAVERELAEKFAEFKESRVAYDKQTGQMGVDNSDPDQRHGLYINGKLVKTVDGADAANNLKKRDPRFKDATVKKIAESSLNEFAPGNGGGESGRWYTDDQMTDIVGDGWWQDLDLSGASLGIPDGDVPKEYLIREAQAWLDDQGYNVQVLNVNVDDDNCDWYIEGDFGNPNFASRGMHEGEDDMFADRQSQKIRQAIIKAGKGVIEDAPHMWPDDKEMIEFTIIDGKDMIRIGKTYIEQGIEAGNAAFWEPDTAVRDQMYDAVLDVGIDMNDIIDDLDESQGVAEGAGVFDPMKGIHALFALERQYKSGNIGTYDELMKKLGDHTVWTNVVGHNLKQQVPGFTVDDFWTLDSIVRDLSDGYGLPEWFRIINDGGWENLIEKYKQYMSQRHGQTMNEQGVAEGMTPAGEFLNKQDRLKAGDKVYYKGQVVGIATGDMDDGRVVFTPVPGYGTNPRIASLPIDVISLREGEVIPFPKRDVKPQEKKPDTKAKKNNVKAISKDRYAKTGPSTMQGPTMASIYEDDMFAPSKAQKISQGLRKFAEELQGEMNAAHASWQQDKSWYGVEQEKIKFIQFLADNFNNRSKVPYTLNYIARVLNGDSSVVEYYKKHAIWDADDYLKDTMGHGFAELFDEYAGQLDEEAGDEMFADTSRIKTTRSIVADLEYIADRMIHDPDRFVDERGWSEDDSFEIEDVQEAGAIFSNLANEFKTKGLEAGIAQLSHLYHHTTNQVAEWIIDETIEALSSEYEVDMSRFNLEEEDDMFAPADKSTIAKAAKRNVVGKVAAKGRASRKSDTELQEIVEIAQQVFGSKYSSGTISGGKVYRISLITQGLGGRYHYSPIASVSKNDKIILGDQKKKFYDMLTKRGLDTSRVEVKYHMGATLYTSVRIKMKDEVSESTKQFTDLEIAVMEGGHELVSDSRIIGNDTTGNLYYKPDPQQSKAQLIKQLVPGNKVDVLISALAKKFGVKPTDFEWTPSVNDVQISEYGMTTGGMTGMSEPAAPQQQKAAPTQQDAQKIKQNLTNLRNKLPSQDASQLNIGQTTAALTTIDADQKPSNVQQQAMAKGLAPAMADLMTSDDPSLANQFNALVNKSQQLKKQQGNAQ